MAREAFRWRAKRSNQRSAQFQIFSCVVMLIKYVKEFPHEGYRMGDRLSRRQEQNKSEGKPLVAVELHGQRVLILDMKPASIRKSKDSLKASTHLEDAKDPLGSTP